MLQYFLRTTSPALTAEFAQLVERRMLQAILDFSEVLRRTDDASLQEVFDDARRQIGLPILQGGFGITPNECITTPAFYAAVTHGRSFAASTDFKPIQD